MVWNFTTPKIELVKTQGDTWAVLELNYGRPARTVVPVVLDFHIKEAHNTAAPGRINLHLGRVCTVLVGPPQFLTVKTDDPFYWSLFQFIHFNSLAQWQFYTLVLWWGPASNVVWWIIQCAQCGHWIIRRTTYKFSIPQPSRSRNELTKKISAQADNPRLSYSQRRVTCRTISKLARQDTDKRFRSSFTFQISCCVLKQERLKCDWVENWA